MYLEPLGAEFARNVPEACASLVVQERICRAEEGARAAVQLYCKVCRAPKGHTNVRILHFGSTVPEKGIRETMVCRIPTFAWSFGPLVCCTSLSLKVQSTRR